MQEPSGVKTTAYATPCGTEGPDCLCLDEFGVPQPQSLPWVTNGVPTTERCDGSGATCIVTPIPGP